MIRYFLLLLVLLPGSFQTLRAQTVTGDQLAGNDVYTVNNNYVYGQTLDMDFEESTGKRVVAWEGAESSQTQNRDVSFQIFNADMSTITGIIKPATNTLDQYGVRVLVDQQNSSFIITWTSNHAGDYDIYARRYAMDGTALSQETRINNYTLGRQTNPVLTLDYTSREAIIGWIDLDGRDITPGTITPGNYGSFANRVSLLSDASSPLTIYYQDFQINIATQNNQYLYDIEVSQVTGELYTAWHSNATSSSHYDAIFRKFTRNADGTFTGAPAEIKLNNEESNYSQSCPDITVNQTSGDYIVNWLQTDNSGWGVNAKVFDKYGYLVKDEFRVNTDQNQNERYGFPAWDELTNTIVWFYYYAYSGYADIRYILYDEDFNAVGTEQTALPSGVNLLNTWTNYRMKYDQKHKKILLGYKVSESQESAFTAIYLRELTYSVPAFSATQADPAYTSTTDETMTWVNETTYDENGNVIASARSYFDELGRPIQNQAKNIEEDQVLENLLYYDRLGRPALKTLTVPMSDGSINPRTGDGITHYQMEWGQNFSAETNSGIRSWEDFDYLSSESVPAGGGTVGNPSVPEYGSTLGAFFRPYTSGVLIENHPEPLTDRTSYPYTRIDYNDNISGGKIRVAKPGDKLRMGSGNEQESIILTLENDLNDHYLKLRNTYTGESTTSLAGQGYKKIYTDENGQQRVLYTDKAGRTLATAIPSDEGTTKNLQTDIGIPYYLENIYIPSGKYARFEITGPGAATVSITEPSAGLEFSLTEYDLLSGGRYLWFRGFAPFNVKAYTGDYEQLSTGLYELTNVTETEYPSEYAVTPSSVDVYVQDPSAFSVDGSDTYIKIRNLETGNVTYEGQAQYFTGLSQGGYYRVSVTGYSPSNSLYFLVSVKNQFTASDFAYYFYDDVGRLIKEVAPKGVDPSNTTSQNFTTSYTYNNLGMMLSADSPDEGLTQCLYRKDGRMRFSQDAEQRSQNSYAFINYDSHGRVIETGTYNIPGENGPLFVDQFTYEEDQANDVSGACSYYSCTIGKIPDIGPGGGLITSDCQDVKFLYYDVPDYYAPRTQQFLPGRLSASYHKQNYTDNVADAYSWYSYDEQQRLLWHDQSISDPATSSSLGTKTIDYNYDLLGFLISVIYQNEGDDRFEHRYYYDANKRLSKVKTRAGSGALVENTEYQFYLTGRIKRKELGENLQGVDYIFNVNGLLKALNHPALDSRDPGGDSFTDNPGFSKDLFGMVLEYFDGDYLGNPGGVNNFATTTNLTSYTPNQFNGNIRSVTWNTFDSNGPLTPAQYTYTYDKKYQLTGAVFGSHDFSANTYTADESNYKIDLNYDLNGNITQYNRTNSAGTLIYADQSLYSYNYNNSGINNRLGATGNSNGPAGGTYSYFANGRLESHSGNSYRGASNYTYNTAGLVTGVYKDGAHTQPYATFDYNERGQRMRKVSYNTSTWEVSGYTWYVNDLAGNRLAVVTADASGIETTREMLVFGGSRIGTCRIASDGTTDYEYEIRDHLGNVRVTFHKSSATGDAEMLSKADYYPFGDPIPERSVVSSPASRFGYQGAFAEHDPETMYDNFALRMFDPTLGRFFTPDPMHQFHSPYLGMGNNPIIFVDPTGGEGDDEPNGGGNEGGDEAEPEGGQIGGGGEADPEEEEDDVEECCQMKLARFTTAEKRQEARSFRAACEAARAQSTKMQVSSKGGSYNGMSGDFSNVNAATTVASGGVIVNFNSNNGQGSYSLTEGPSQLYIDGQLAYSVSGVFSMSTGGDNGNYYPIIDGVAIYGKGGTPSGTLEAGVLPSEILSIVSSTNTDIGFLFTSADMLLAHQLGIITKNAGTRSLYQAATTFDIVGGSVKMGPWIIDSKVLSAWGSKISGLGKGVGYFGIMVSALQLANGDITWTEAGFDSAAALIGIYGGLPGAGISLLYFGIKIGYEYYTGESLFVKPK